MIDHVSIAVSDLQQSDRFYTGLLGVLGMVRLVVKDTAIGFGKTYPEFWINLRADAQPAGADDGVHVCLRAPSPDAVSSFYHEALEAGGTSEAPPQRWPQYNDRYFAAFVRDPDGNRIEAVHFTAATAKFVL